MLSPSTLFMVMLLMLVFMAWYANSSKRNKILCRFRRANKTMVKKWVKMQSRYVIADGHKYDVIPSRITFEWYTAGIVHMLFPQWIASLDFTYGKRLPLDPNEMNYDWDNPETRKAIDTADMVQSYFRTSNPTPASKRETKISQYLPWIAIGLVLVVAWYFNQKMTGFGGTLDAVINQLNAINK